MHSDWTHSWHALDTINIRVVISTQFQHKSNSNTKQDFKKLISNLKLVNEIR